MYRSTRNRFALVRWLCAAITAIVLLDGAAHGRPETLFVDVTGPDDWLVLDGNILFDEPTSTATITISALALAGLTTDISLNAYDQITFLVPVGVSDNLSLVSLDRIDLESTVDTPGVFSATAFTRLIVNDDIGGNTAGPVVLSAPDLRIAATSIDAFGSLSITASPLMLNGFGNQSLVCHGSGTLTIDGSVEKDIGDLTLDSDQIEVLGWIAVPSGGLTATGRLDMTGDVTAVGDLLFEDDATFEGASGQTVTGGSIQFDGSMNKQGGNLTVTGTGDVGISGLVNVEGSLSLEGDGILTIESDVWTIEDLTLDANAITLSPWDQVVSAMNRITFIGPVTKPGSTTLDVWPGTEVDFSDDVSCDSGSLMVSGNCFAAGDLTAGDLLDTSNLVLDGSVDQSITVNSGPVIATCIEKTNAGNLVLVGQSVDVIEDVASLGGDIDIYGGTRVGQRLEATTGSLEVHGNLNAGGDVLSGTDMTLHGWTTLDGTGPQLIQAGDFLTAHTALGKPTPGDLELAAGGPSTLAFTVTVEQGDLTLTGGPFTFENDGLVAADTGVLHLEGELAAGPLVDLDISAIEISSIGVGGLTAGAGAAVDVQADPAILTGVTTVHANANMSFSGLAIFGGAITIAPGAAIIAADDVGIAADGTLALNGGTVAANGLQINGLVNGFGNFDGNVTNDGTVTVTADLQVIGDCDNTGSITVQNGTLTILGALTGDGVLIGDIAGGIASGSDSGMFVQGDFAPGPDASLHVSAGGVLRAGGAFDVAIDDSTRVDLADAELRLVALTDQTLEAMSTNIGAHPDGFDRSLPGHFPIGTLRIGPTPTTVTLADTHDNDGLGQGLCEAVYARDLVIDEGATLITNGCRVYYQTLVNDGTIASPADVVPVGFCEGDTDGDGVVNVNDLVNVILDWDTDGSGNGGDVDGNGIVNVDDLVRVVVLWGPCP